MPMMKKCPKCGKMLEEDASFCTECGSNVGGVFAEEVEQAVNQEPTPAQQDTVQQGVPVNPKPQVIVVQSLKSMGVGLTLTFFFGPLGMLYSTVVGALVMMVITGVIFLLTFGLGILVTWPICMVWTYIAIKNHNQKLIAGASL